MAANIMDEILKQNPDWEECWKEMEERFKKDPTEREMLSLKYQQMLERERLKENLPEPEFTKTKKEEETSKVTSKVTFKVSGDLEEAANNAVIALVPSFGQKYSDGSYVSSCIDCFNREELLELFKAGANWKERKLMAKAVDGVAMPNDDEIWCDLKSFDLKEGNKVKVIIIKEG